MNHYGGPTRISLLRARQNCALGALGSGEVDAVAAAAAALASMQMPTGSRGKPLSAAELARREEKRAEWAAIEAKHAKDRWWRDNKPILLGGAIGVIAIGLFIARRR